VDFARPFVRAGQTLLDAVLPPLCLGCNEIVATPGALCPDCWPHYSFIAAPHCQRCGIPFSADLGEGALCVDCLTRPPHFRRARAVLVYDDKSRRVVLPLKHGDRTDMAKACGKWMARAGGELIAEADLVAPVPLHWRRLFMRRYNQAALLARIAANSGKRGDGDAILAPDLLRRARWTGSQAGLKAAERRRNVLKAFEVHPRWLAKLKGRTVLLVDDVLTTGATVEACTGALKRAGAAHVDVLTLARVVRAAI
jgi:ComF family protein